MRCSSLRGGAPWGFGDGAPQDKPTREKKREREGMMPEEGILFSVWIKMFIREKFITRGPIGKRYGDAC
jgi:hypothetical protein